MHYILKTFFPLPNSRKYFTDVDELIARLDEVMDYAQNFYEQRNASIDLDNLLLLDEGYRVYILRDIIDHPKFEKNFLKEKPLTMHPLMFEIPSRYEAKYA